MHQPPQPKRIAIIGAGVTGLTAAFALHNRGHTVHVIEKSDRVGGVIQSTKKDGYLVESGPNTMLLNKQSLADFFSELGLAGEVIDASPHAKNRFIVRDGEPVAAPMSFVQFVRTPLLGAKAKARLLCEPFIGRGDPPFEESVASFARRRLGSEAVDYAINPLVGGIFAGDPEKLSIRFAFPKLQRFEEEQGSLVRGAMAAGRARRKSGTPRFKSRSVSFRQGLHAIIDALVHVVGDSLFLNTTVSKITPGSPWRLGLTRPDSPAREIEVDAVVVTTPAHATAELPFATAGQNPLTVLSGIEYPPVASLALGFRRNEVKHPLDGYGVLVPEVEDEFKILGTLFNSSLFPERAPEGCVLLTTFVGGMRRPEIARLEAPQLQEVVLTDLRKLLGVSGEPVFSRLTSWPRAIPQYNVGFQQFRAAIDEAEAAMPGLFVGGQSRDGVSVGDCIRSGLNVANKAGV